MSSSLSASSPGALSARPAPPPRRPARTLAAGLAFLAALGLGPRVLVGRDADVWLDDDPSVRGALADAVASDLLEGISTAAFHTGSPRFDGEWALGTHVMGALGLAQVAADRPAFASRHRPAVARAVEVLVDDDTYVFARDAWGEGPFDHLEDGEGHAYLGYVALALGALREVDPATPHAALHDRLITALAARLAQSPLGVVETYPGEAYPCDIASIAGALGQHDRLTGGDHRALLAWLARSYRARWIDPSSGYLVQAVDPRTGAPRDGPRGSGTALAAYFWSFADLTLAAELDRALLDRGRAELAGLSAIREHAGGGPGHGDIDSGPVLLGVSVSATGFALSAARRAGDRHAFRTLWRTASLFGVPVDRGARRRFLAGGPLGNAILLAMATARRS